MEAYKRWVRRNKDYVHSLESLANGLTWCLPERFSASELGAEAVTAILGVITAINEHIIETTPAPTHEDPPEPSSFPYGLCISTVKDLETLIEVAAEHFYGEAKKWNFVAATEGIKVLIRLALFRNSGYRMVLHGGETPNTDKELDPSSSPYGDGNFTKYATQMPAHFSNNFAQNRALSALSRFGENARMVSEPMWLQRMQHQQSIVQPPSPVVEKPTISSILSERGFRGALFLIGEMLFITRPLIYVLLIRKYGTRSWAPWFLSLAVDLLGVGIFPPFSFSASVQGNKRYLPSTSEKEEMKRRKLLWALYLMRDPFFSKYTRKRLESTEKLLEPVPIVGMLTEKIIELILGAQMRYTYMSGS
ncbi:peroxisome biogenesis protein 16 [Punica granatum]|uniref:Peroxisomal membrane protein PEX16 n=2 Tax=Punica granatum TaxID=22663 RepID=A0A6P8C3K1_PUNGR|nr:peroxisome biogenesis protein 16 [Punica granatum]